MKPGAALRMTDGTFAQLNELGNRTEQRVSVMVVRLQRDPNNRHQLVLGDFAPEKAWMDEIAASADVGDLSSLRAHRKAWRQVGLRLATASATDVDVFVPLSGVPLTASVVVGDDDDDDDDDAPLMGRADLCGYASDDGFVVADTVPFTQAPAGTSDHVDDTHDAVHAFEDWVPSTDKGRSFRRFVCALEQRHARKDDELHFGRGTSVPAYGRPPRNAHASKRRRRRK